MLFRKAHQDHEILKKTIFPIDDTEKIITRFARSFPATKKYRLEVFGQLIGLEEDVLTHLVIPKYAMGVKNDGHYVMRNLVDTNSRTQVMLATNEDKGESGILIMVSPKKIDQQFLKGNFTFIPAELLILNRPIIEFIPAEYRSQLCSRMKSYETVGKQIRNIIKRSKEKKQIAIQNERHRWVSICFLREPLLQIDAFLSSNRSYPLNTFLLKTLTLNKFGRQLTKSKKTYYGRVHTHYGYDSWELVRDPLIRALHRMDKTFFELMSPVDAISMIDSAQAVQEISEHRLQAEQILEGVIALNPKNLHIIGTSFFDRGIIEVNEEVNAFKKIAAEAYNSRDIAVNKNWFQYIRMKSKLELPDYTNPKTA